MDETQAQCTAEIRCLFFADIFSPFFCLYLDILPCYFYVIDANSSNYIDQFGSFQIETA